MGVVYSYIDEVFPPKSKFTEEDIPDLEGRVCIVTGANIGIGKEAVRALLSHGAKVYLAARSPEKAEVAIAELKERTGKLAYFLKLDLSNFSSIETAAKEFLSKESRLDILFNNAGVMWPPLDWITTEGYDWQFGCNVLGPYYFTKLLLPIMLETAKESPNTRVRIINSSSIAHRLFSDDIRYDTLKDSPARKKMGAHALYNQSKFAMVLFSRELARQYGDKGIISIGLNPGSINSNLTRHLSYEPKFILKYMLSSPALGALTGLWAATSPECADMNGKYLIPFARLGKAEKATESPEKCEKLWSWLEDQVKNRSS